MRRVLIVGATGFIGRNLTEVWSRSCDDEVIATGLEGDDFSWMRDLEGVRPRRLDLRSGTGRITEALAGCDVVVYLAGGLTPGSSNRLMGAELEEIPRFGSFLEACVSAGVGEVLFMSSGGAVYGVKRPPCSELDATDPITTYGLVKLSCEKLLGIVSRQHGMAYRAIRLSNPYGPHQRPMAGQGVIATFVHKAIAGEDIVIWGDGSVVRDFIYIDDAVRGVLSIARCPQLANRVVNLGSGEGVAISEIANLVVGVTRSASRIKYLPGRDTDVPENWLDMSLYREFCPRPQLMPLEAGIARTAEWQGLDSARLGHS